MSPTAASVVRTMADTEQEFSIALRQTAVGSIIPILIMLPYLNFSASKPYP